VRRSLSDLIFAIIGYCNGGALGSMGPESVEGVGDAARSSQLLPYAAFPASPRILVVLLAALIGGAKATV